MSAICNTIIIHLLPSEILHVGNGSTVIYWTFSMKLSGSFFYNGFIDSQLYSIAIP